MKIEATKIERCKDGYWTHPELPDMGETVSKAKLEQFETEQGFKVHMVSMESDAEEKISEAYFEHGDPGCLLWEPTKPSDDAFLLSIHDTEDGPFAWWAVPQIETPKQVKLDAWIAEYALLLITQCHFDLSTAIEMGKSALENVDNDIDGYSPSEAVDDEIDAMRSCC
ncbi:hypothetical protein [Vibrio splendidus]|uniref:hypothetical protein n=1 Tax=Vibrio splendidus TaxID=29497 RepID=UPI000C841381|nr:hypothetical protein [Vibrio splendidus]PMP51616.1 hypothetical protein BCS83_02110 [Vibrio splendidus]